MATEASQGGCGYAIIFMDCSMPVMDGLEATCQLRNKMRAGEVRQAPIIGLSAYSNEAEVQLCHDAGMDEVLAKPVSCKKLEATLRQYGIIV